MGWAWWHRLRWLVAIPAVAVPLAAFFVVYNHVVVDANLQNLKLSLKVLGRAGAVAKAEAAMTLIDQNLLVALALAEANPADIAALQYAKGVLADDPQRQVEDVQTVVATLVGRQVEQRGATLRALDDVHEAVGEMAQQIWLAPRRLLGRPQGSDEIGVDHLTEAAQLERLGEWVKAEALYEQLMRDYPAYRGRGHLRLRLGYLYQRQRAFARAEQAYQQVLQETADPLEAGVARQLLDQLARARHLSEEAGLLRQRLASAATVVDRQQAAFDLGNLQMQLFDFDGAIQSFGEAVESQPGAPLAAHAEFRRAWCLKYLGRYDEAVPAFEALARLAPETALPTMAQTQIADAYRATGQYEAAAEALEAAVGGSQDQALSAMLTAQLGSLHLMDLKQPEQAKAYFRRVETAFPASQISAIEQTIQQFQTEKAMTQLVVERAGAGIPVMGWLETAIPSFVEIYATRLAQFMQSVGEPSFSRRLSEADLRHFLVDRASERFPGQLKDVEVALDADAFRGAMSVRVGAIWFPITWRARVYVANLRPQVEILALTVGQVPVPGVLNQVLEAQVNRSLDRARLPLQIHRLDMAPDGVDVAVTLVD